MGRGRRLPFGPGRRGLLRGVRGGALRPAGSVNPQRQASALRRSLFTAEKASFAEKDTFCDKVRDIGFEPERGNRSACLLSR